LDAVRAAQARFVRCIWQTIGGAIAAFGIGVAFGGDAAVYIVAAWFVIMFVVTARHSTEMISINCPRCGERFFAGRLFMNLFSKSCRNCGLSMTRQFDDSGSA